MLVNNTPPARRRIPSRRAAASLTLTGVALVGLAAVGQLDFAVAGPEGGTVAAGSASITTSGSDTVVNTTSQRTILDFRSFDLNADESITFNQPNADAAVLNRVRANATSFIDGTVASNGQVYIVNPAGVTFGPNATVNVSRLVTAAATISPSDFRAGIDRFLVDGSGQVVNNSSSIFGDRGVVFVGEAVRNNGTVRADGGTVALVVGRDVLLSEGPDGRVFARIEGFNDPNTGEATDGGPRVDTRVSNGGTIDNPNGDVLIGAGDLFGLSVLRQGLLRGRNVTLDAGPAPLRLSEDSSRFSTISPDASITLNAQRLEYFCEVAPNGRITLNAPGGFVNLTPGGAADCGPAFVNGRPFPLAPGVDGPGGPGTPATPGSPTTPGGGDGGPLAGGGGGNGLDDGFGFGETFIDRYARLLPADPLVLGGGERLTADGAQQLALAERLNIRSRGPADRGDRGAADAAVVISDLSSDPTDRRVSPERISYLAAANALDAYEAVFGPASTSATGPATGFTSAAAPLAGFGGYDADGRPQVDGPYDAGGRLAGTRAGGPDGTVALAVPASAAGGSGPDPAAASTEPTREVRDRLQEAADLYMADREVTEIDPDAFAAWLADADPRTLNALSDLDQLDRKSVV